MINNNHSINFYFHENDNSKSLMEAFWILSDFGYEYSPTPTSQSGKFNFSFDDNYKNWKNLIELPFEVSLFLNTVHYDLNFNRENYLRSINYNKKKEYHHLEIEELKELSNKGCYFGLHTHSHINCRKNKLNDIIIELEKNFDSINNLELKYNGVFAVPYGMYKYLPKNYYSQVLQLPFVNSIAFANPGYNYLSSEKILHRIDYSNKLNVFENIKRATICRSKFFLSTINIDTIGEQT